MTTIISFSLGIIIGAITGTAIIPVLLLDGHSRPEPEPATGIDPKELVAWLENYTHNYEYIAPPTTGEIIRKINEMGGGQHDRIIREKNQRYN